MCMHACALTCGHTHMHRAHTHVDTHMHSANTHMPAHPKHAHAHTFKHTSTVHTLTRRHTGTHAHAHTLMGTGTQWVPLLSTFRSALAQVTRYHFLSNRRTVRLSCPHRHCAVRTTGLGPGCDGHGRMEYPGALGWWDPAPWKRLGTVACTVLPGDLNCLAGRASREAGVLPSRPR